LVGEGAEVVDKVRMQVPAAGDQSCGNDSLIWPHRDGPIWPRV
jgi:hypothetical protein